MESRESRETAGTEAGKELALWRVALAFGFVFELDDMLRMPNRDAPKPKG